MKNNYLIIGALLGSLQLLNGEVAQQITKIKDQEPKPPIPQETTKPKEEIKLRDYDIVGGMGSPQEPYLIVKKPKGNIIRIDGKFYRVIEDEKYDHYTRMKAVTEVYDLQYRKLNNEYMMDPTPEKARELIEYEKREFVDPIDNSPAYPTWQEQFDKVYPVDLQVKKNPITRHSFSKQTRKILDNGDAWKYNLITEDAHKYLIVFVPSINSIDGMQFGCLVQKMYEENNGEDNKKVKFIGFIAGGENGGENKWYLYQRRFSPSVKFDFYTDMGQIETILNNNVFTNVSNNGKTKTNEYVKNNQVAIYFIDKENKKIGQLSVDGNNKDDYARLAQAFRGFVK